MKANQTAATAAAFGAEGMRGKMVQEWTFYCWCGYRSAAVGLDVENSANIAKMAGWRYTSKRGWECPAHRKVK